MIACRLTARKTSRTRNSNATAQGSLYWYWRAAREGERESANAAR